MSNPSIAIAEAFKQFSQATVSAVRRNTFLTLLLFTHFSSALTNKERPRLNQTHYDLRVLYRERDDALTDFNASKDQARVWVAEVDKCKSEAGPGAGTHVRRRER